MSSFFQAVEKARKTHPGKPEAVSAWLEPLSVWHIDENEYQEWCYELQTSLVLMEAWQCAGWVDEYLGRTEKAQERYKKAGAVFDFARTLNAVGTHLEARDGFESLRRWLHAAQSASLGGDHEGSIRFLQTWLKQKGAGYSRYYRALAYIQVGDACKNKGDADKGNRAFLEASQLLEEQADLEERRGQRRAAFECYQALMSMGILADSHEALIEGGLNCIRLLKEMNQRFNTMRHYHDLIHHSRQMGAWRSAAEIYQEASAYAKQVSFVYADWFWNEAGLAWQQVANQQLTVNSPVELVENALVSAGRCFSQTQNLDNLRQAYQMLCALDLSEKKKAKYARILTYLEEETEDRTQHAPAFPEHFQRPSHNSNFGWDALLPLELSAEPLAMLGALLAPDKDAWQVQRRRTLIFLLRQHAQGQAQPHQQPDLDQIYLLTQINHPHAFSPLRFFWNQGSREIRLGILNEAWRHFKQVESLEIIAEGLEAKEPSLQDAALKALDHITFPQALEGLVELAAAHKDLEIKKACYRSMAKIGTDAATEYLLDICRTQTGEIADFILEVLMDHSQERMLSALDRNINMEPSPFLSGQLQDVADNIRSSRVGKKQR